MILVKGKRMMKGDVRDATKLRGKIRFKPFKHIIKVQQVELLFAKCVFGDPSSGRIMMLLELSL